ncbi:MAG: hypothetical protein AB1813_17755, partial [Verrucomicrobiota bacterium]
MNRNSQRGVALVITLIMLGLVTFMAVVFLAISRREKASVTATADLTDARLMADAALARAQGEVIARVLATTNPLNYQLMVSTNYLSKFGYRRDSNPTSLTNVGYTGIGGRPLPTDDFRQNLANLLYDPRPPVFVPIDSQGNTDFRFYLDFNRNGRYDSNGFFPVIAADGTYFDTNGIPTTTRPPLPVLTNYFVGDPEWIGVLQRPDLPHSETNRFSGRYAFLVLPAGKSLDLNFMHNNAKRLDTQGYGIDGYTRNEGVGSWELNLAAFLTELNTNAWPPATYVFRTSPTTPSSGPAFDDARFLLRHRYFNGVNHQLNSVRAEMGPLAGNAMLTDGIDGYADGPLRLTPDSINREIDQNGMPVSSADPVTFHWSGSANPGGFFDVQDVFNPRASAINRAAVPNISSFVNRLHYAQTNSISSYDRYSFYRMLGQLSVDSRPANSNWVFLANHQRAPMLRLNVNYRNEYANAQTNFFPWSPLDGWTNNLTPFFTLAADRLLRATLQTNITRNLNGFPVSTNFYVGMDLWTNQYVGQLVPVQLGVRDDFSITNIQLIYFGPTNGIPYWMTNNEYSSTVHRLLQLSANVQDATSSRVALSSVTSSNLPSVFRPVFRKTTTNVVIAGYEPEYGTNFLNRRWVTLDELKHPSYPETPPNQVERVNVFGVPLIIGAKKGYPNFNEVLSQSSVQISRKLEVVKPSTNNFRPDSTWSTNQMYVIGISNVFGIEAWNSYTQDFRRDFELRMTNYYGVGLHRLVGSGTNGQLNLVEYQLGILSSNVVTNVWTNRLSGVMAFKVAATNNVFRQNSVFSARTGQFMPLGTTNTFESGFDVPQLFYVVTNRITYILIDRPSGQLVDMVNLDHLVSVMNLNQRLLGPTNFNSQFIRGAGSVDESSFWITNLVRGAGGPTVGITNQVAAALGMLPVGSSIWRDWNALVNDKDKSIHGFRVFMGLEPTNRPPMTTRWEVPFTPTRVMVNNTTWQANDPLVHYTVADLTDPILTDPFGINNFRVVPPRTPLTNNLGRLNERYNPWGGNPEKSGDPRAFDFGLKDPLVRQADDWEFPTNKFPSIGWLGRVHRGTPWQTVYFKAGLPATNVWRDWAGSLATYPTNDWKLLEIFSAAPNENAARGLLSVNQTNIAAWAAVLSGVHVVSNSL